MCLRQDTKQRITYETKYKLPGIPLKIFLKSAVSNGSLNKQKMINDFKVIRNDKFIKRNFKVVHG